jgi:glycolate oxidase iron-sulfur subunit
MADTTQGQATNTLEALTDQCVQCGLCLPHCPTYALDRHEAESPRGRIALARQFARGNLAVTAETASPIDRCLGCLACQAVCPSQVRYEEILVRTRALLAQRRPPPPAWRRILARPSRLHALVRLGTALRAHRWLPSLARLLPATSAWRRIVREMPMAPPVGAGEARQGSGSGLRGRIGLFPGCVARTLDRDTLAAARTLLEALNYAVIVPEHAVCCGALALHAGDSAAAQASAEVARKAWAGDDVDTVLVSASGCLGSLRDHALRERPMRVLDILGFLARDAGIDRLRFRPLPARMALHVPCTQTSVGDGAAPVRALLGRIEGLQIVELPAQPGCCGAAGSYFLEQPERADRLRALKLDQVQAQEPQALLTTNIGCRVFLGNGLRQRQRQIPVLHPLVLLARQLDTGGQ